MGKGRCWVLMGGSAAWEGVGCFFFLLLGCGVGEGGNGWCIPFLTL